MPSNRFNIDIVANDRASQVLAQVAAQMNTLTQSTQNLAQAGQQLGQSFNQGAAQTGRAANIARTPLQNLTRTLKNVSVGLAAINAPGATAFARLAALSKAAGMLAGRRAAAAATTAATTPPTPSGTPGSLWPVVRGMAGQAAADVFGPLMRGAGAAAVGLVAVGLATYKMVTAADAFVGKYSGKAQDIVYNASDIGVSTKFLQNMEHIGQMHGLQPGAATANLFSLSKLSREALLGQNTGAAQAFNLLGIGLGTPQHPRNVESLVGAINNVFAQNKNLSATQLAALAVIGQGTEMRRLYTAPPEYNAALAAQTSAAVYTPEDLKKFTTRQITATKTGIGKEAAGMRAAATLSPISTGYQEALGGLFDWFARDRTQQAEVELPPEAMAERAVDRANAPWQAPLIYKPQSPLKPESQSGAGNDDILRKIELQITTDPGVNVREKNPQQDGVSVRIFKNGVGAK